MSYWAWLLLLNSVKNVVQDFFKKTSVCVSYCCKSEKELGKMVRKELVLQKVLLRDGIYRCCFSFMASEDKKIGKMYVSPSQRNVLFYFNLCVICPEIWEKSRKFHFSVLLFCFMYVYARKFEKISSRSFFFLFWGCSAVNYHGDNRVFMWIEY